MKKLDSKGLSPVAGLLMLIIIGLIGGTGYYVYQSKNKTNEALDNAAKSQSEPQPTAETERKPTTSRLDETKKAIEIAMNTKNYASLEPHMADTVSYARQSSDVATNNASKAEAIQHFNYFGPPPDGIDAESPWDFSVMDNDPDFAGRIKKAQNPAFENAHIGRSKDKAGFVAFKFNENGLITSFWYGIATVL